MTKQWTGLVWGCGLGLLLLLFVGGCPRSPIPIGFVGGLTGRLSELGVSGRNGVQLAVEEINAAGGIRGRPLNLIIKDNRHDRQQARQAVQSLIDAGVVAVIGHMTSAMSLSTQDIINRRQTLMISPTTSTDQLSGRDDYFLRVATASSLEARAQARYGVNKLGLKRFAVIYDLANQGFTVNFHDHFQEELESLGGKLVCSRPFRSGADLAFLEIAKAVLATEPQGILLISGALDTAMFCQQIRKIDSKVFLFGSGWAQTQSLIQQGGRAVHGLIIRAIHHDKGREPAFLKFKRAYQKRFGRKPDFPAAFGYEAAQLLFYGIKHATDTADSGAIREAILEKGTFQGLKGEFRLDQWGDAHRRYYVLKAGANGFELSESL